MNPETNPAEMPVPELLSNIPLPDFTSKLKSQLEEWSKETGDKIEELTKQAHHVTQKIKENKQFLKEVKAELGILEPMGKTEGRVPDQICRGIQDIKLDK